MHQLVSVSYRARLVSISSRNRLLSVSYTDRIGLHSDINIVSNSIIIGIVCDCYRYRIGIVSNSIIIDIVSESIVISIVSNSGTVGTVSESIPISILYRPRLLSTSYRTRLSSVSYRSRVSFNIQHYKLGLSTGTVCTGSTNRLIDPASIFASSFILRTSKKHAILYIVRKPTKCVPGGERTEKREEEKKVETQMYHRY